MMQNRKFFIPKNKKNYPENRTKEKNNGGLQNEGALTIIQLLVQV